MGIENTHGDDRRAPATGRTRGVRGALLSTVAVVALAVTATACGGGGDQARGRKAGTGTGSGDSSSAPATPSAGSGNGTGSGTGNGNGNESGHGAGQGGSSSSPSHDSTSPGAERKPGRCTSDQLGIALGGANPGAGNVYYDLSLTNKGKRPCTLDGFPGVSLIRADGQTIGKPAAREGSSHGVVKLAPGHSAHAALHTLNKGVKGGGCWQRPDLLQVYPPGSHQAMTLRTTKPQVCGGTFTVSALK